MFSKTKFFIIILLLPFIIYAAFELIYFNATYPNIYLGETNLTAKNRKQLETFLSTEFKNRENQTLVFNLNTGKPISISLNTNLIKYDTTKTVDKIISYGRTGPLLTQLQQKFSLLTQKQTITPEYQLDSLTLDTLIADQVRQYEKPVLNSQLVLTPTGLALSPSKPGILANRDNTLKEVEKYLQFQTQQPLFKIELETKNPTLTRENSQNALQQASLAISHTITLTSAKIPDKTWELNAPELYQFLEFNYDTQRQQGVVSIANYKVASYSAQFEPLLKKDPVEAKFEQVGSQTVVFQASEDGYTLDTDKLTKEISNKAFSPTYTANIEIPIKTLNPSVTQNTINQYGIKELFASGKSLYTGSSQGRTHNIEVAAEKLNGTVVKPGQTFSMYQTIGDIEKATGFVDSAIIKNGRTVTGVGGGVCQVSTTLFRAALNAGFPIVDRNPHSYRVKYYELDSPPGFDAAIYFPGQDFKFTNNSANNILIQVKLDPQKELITANFYGVKDGRDVQISEPRISNLVDPPAEARIDDPSIPKGIIRQTEFAAVGATVQIDRKVTKDNQTLLSDSIRSFYHPWQSVYLIGTGIPQ